MKTSTRRHPLRFARAFTLVELMVVIFILAVLAGILVPSVTAARTAAKQAATGALLNTIGSGLDMFKSEPKLGRVYPPSSWDTSQRGSPYETGMGNFVARGAQTLVWGLAGADLLGTPGFQIDDSNGIYLNKSNGGLYETNGATPVKQRLGPFIDLSKAKIKKPSETKRPPGSSVNDRPLVIVDSFDMPVLYFAPDPNFSDVQMYWPSGRQSHNDGFLDSSQDPIADQTKFYNYILDNRAKGLSGVNVPQNRDRFLLITAGPDRRYGTRDDVTNFDPSAQE